MPTTKLKKADPHDLATIRGFAERVSKQAQLEADRLDPDRVALGYRGPESDEADLVRKLDLLWTAATHVLYAVRYMEKKK